MTMPESDELHGEARAHDAFKSEIEPALQPLEPNPSHPEGEQPHGPHDVEAARRKVQEAIDHNLEQARQNRQDAA